MPILPDLTYTVCRSVRRKRTVALLVQPEGEVRVIAPARMSLRLIEILIQQKAGWIRQRLDKLRQRPPRRHLHDFVGGAEVPYLGKAYKLRVTRHKEQRAGCHLGQDEIEINVPDASFSPTALKEEVRLELMLWYKKQARREFQERLIVWSERLGVKSGRLIVTSPLRRWGSCNIKGEIRINYRLIMASPELIDYVLAHELCHIRHKNHARSFWRCLEGVIPDYKNRRQQLRAWEKSES